MAAAEVYDYVSAEAADYNQTFSVSPQRVLTEQGGFYQAKHPADDTSEKVVTFSTSPIFFFLLQWDVLSAADAGTIFDWYFDTAKSKGMAKSFKFTHPTDGHTYVVKFDTDLNRIITAGVTLYSIKQMRLKVVGRINDA